MAFTKTSANGKTVYQESYTLPASATIGYSTEIDFFSFDPKIANKNVTVVLNASAVSGTNLDISLYGTWEAGGSKVTLVSDALVADITATGNNVDILDLNAYPMPYYYIGWTADADESANTITLTCIVDEDNVSMVSGDFGGVGADPS
tara:strand:- start:3497 stop:3940 length:444 start_codon:yes stop_codon:yes gene_type:complete